MALSEGWRTTDPSPALLLRSGCPFELAPHGVK